MYAIRSYYDFIREFPKSIADVKHGQWQDKSILIIEDENANYRFLKEVLKPSEVNTFWAENGMDALNLFMGGHRFDLVLLDIKMPHMDGYTTFDRIKEIAPHQPIIAQTAFARPEDERKIREKGFDDYLAKPINPRDLIDVIKHYLD